MFTSPCMESKDSTGKGYGSQQRIPMVIHYGLADLWIDSQHIAESPTRGNSGALTVVAIQCISWQVPVIFQISLESIKRRGETPKPPFFFPLEHNENVFIKTPRIYYECEEKAITLIDGYLTFSKDSTLVVKDLYVFNFWKFICILNLFGLSYQVDRLI